MRPYRLASGGGFCYTLNIALARLSMKQKSLFLYAVLFLVLPVPVLHAGRLPTSFSIGDCKVNLLPNRYNISPYVTFAGRTFMFAYRSDGWLEDDRKRLRYHSLPTNVFTRLEKTAEGVRAEYVHSLYTGKEENRRIIGLCSNEVSFAGGLITVRATMYPFEPGRYRFYNNQKVSQVVIFPDFAGKWVGSSLHLKISKDVAYLNELMPHDSFDKDAWGMNYNHTGPVKEMIFANVPDVIRFGGAGETRFSCNRYKGGFEASPFLRNDDVMHKPAWDGPVSFEYFVQMTK